MPNLLRIAAAFFALAGGLGAAAAEDLVPALQKIKAAGAISMGYRDALIPFSYADAQQQPIGFALDLCALVAGKVKETLGLPDLKINSQSVTPANAVSLLKAGSIDLDCGPALVKEELTQEVAFSNPVFASELRWIVPRKLRVEREGRRRTRTETISPSTTADLKGKPVAVTRGSPAASLVLTLSTDRSLGLSILEGQDDAGSFKLVESGKASAFIADGVVLLGLKAAAKNPDALGFLNEAYPGPAYALMLRNKDHRFKELVDAVLAEALRTGEYAKFYAKWFESPIPPKNVNLDYPMPEKLKEMATKNALLPVN